MKNKYLIKLSLIILMFSWLGANAQDPMSLYYLDNVPQSNFVNPAMAPRANVFIGIPGVNSIYLNFNTNLPTDVLIQKTDSGSVSLLNSGYDYSLLYDAIGDGASIRSYELLSPLIFGFKTGKSYITFSVTEKVKLNAFLADGFFQMIEKGFPDGSNYSFNNTGLDVQLYQEYALGYSRNITQKLRVGARLKLLQGLASIKSDVQKANLQTSEDVWNIDMKGDIYSSGPLELSVNEDGIIDSVSIAPEFKDPDAKELFSKYGTNFSNLGFAIDIGATYQLNPAWSFSASLNDLGFINWNNDLNSIHFNGKYDFVGLDIDNSNVDSIQQAVDDLMDTIKTVVNYHAGSKSFSTGLGTMLHVGAEYHVNHVMSIGFLSRSTFDKNYFHQEFNLSTNFNLYKILTANLNYNVALNGENYAGLGLAVRGGPVQFYLLLDHIPIVYRNYITSDGTKIPGPNDLRAFNVMLGLNLIFGAHGYKDGPKIDAYSEF